MRTVVSRFEVENFTPPFASQQSLLAEIVLFCVFLQFRCSTFSVISTQGTHYKEVGNLFLTSSQMMMDDAEHLKRRRSFADTAGLMTFCKLTKQRTKKIVLNLNSFCKEEADRLVLIHILMPARLNVWYCAV